MANTLLKVYPPELMNFSRAENSKEIIITNVAKVDVTFKVTKPLRKEMIFR